jgi:hypothetical protein
MTEPSEIEADIAEFEANRFHSLSPETFVRRLIAALREAQDSIIGTRSANTKLKVELARLREALENLCKQIEATEEHGAEADEDFCPVCDAIRKARAALAGSKGG